MVDGSRTLEGFWSLINWLQTNDCTKKRGNNELLNVWRHFYTFLDDHIVFNSQTFKQLLKKNISFLILIQNKNNKKRNRKFLLEMRFSRFSLVRFMPLFISFDGNTRYDSAKKWIWNKEKKISFICAKWRDTERIINSKWISFIWLNIIHTSDSYE